MNTPPPGFTAQDNAQAFALTKQLVASVEQAPTHVALTALLSAYMNYAVLHDCALVAAEQMVAHGGQILTRAMLAAAEADKTSRISVPASGAIH